MFFAHKTPQTVAYLWQLGGFFSAAPTAQNSPELYFHFINSFIQLSPLRSLEITNSKVSAYNSLKLRFFPTFFFHV